MPFINVSFKLCYSFLLALIIFITYCNDKSYASVLVFGKDIDMQWYVDKTNELKLDNFLLKTDKELQVDHHIQSFGFSPNTYWVKTYLQSSHFQGDNLWLKIGPSFIDNLTIYYRRTSENNDWVRKDFGDRSTKVNGDLYYRENVLILPPPLIGYELVFEIHSTSPLLLLATLSSAQDFLSSTQDTAFWCFYFGAALIIVVFALSMVVILRRRLLLGVSLFLFNYLLVAALHGFPAWIFGPVALPIQDYMVNSLSLLGCATTLWLYCEVFSIKDHILKFYHFLVTIICLYLLLQVSIPLDLYGKAMQLATITFVLISPVLIVVSFVLWHRKNENCSSLFIVLISSVNIFSMAFFLLSLNGFIPFNNFIFSMWQCTLLIYTFSFVFFIGIRMLGDNKILEKNKIIALDLSIERKASFNQRQFMGMVSHEFRTPLGIIVVTLNNLRCSDEFIIHKTRLDRIHRAVNRLVQLTNNCLTEARLSSKTLCMVKKKVKLLEIVKAASIVVELSEKHHLNVNFNGRAVDLDDSSPEIYMDEELISIVIANILDNSVKYSPEGVIQIDILLHNTYLELRFSDEGPGIPAGQAELVFDRYYRSDVQKTKSRGTGLGLYVARQIVRSHGGELRLVINGSVARTFVMEFTSVQAIGGGFVL